MPKGLCVVECCDRPIYQRGWCSGHYSRWRKHGDVLADKPFKRFHVPPEAKFADSYVVDKNGCWVWIRRLKSTGYGDLSIDRRRVSAHRWSYEHFVGPIPDGLQIDHLCRNRACVNPAHLEPVTPHENVQRGLRGRLRTHCKHGHELTPENTRLAKVNNWIARQCRTCARIHDAGRRERQRQRG